MTNLLSLALCMSAAVAVWVAMLVHRRPSFRGARPFVWLFSAIAWWCIAGAAHALAGTLAVKLFWAKVQYVGIVSVPPLWLQFTASYAGAAWVRDRRWLAAFWTLPALTLVAALTNDVHLSIWTSVTLTGNGLASYQHGWWFWLYATHSYVLVLAGALLVSRGLGHVPRAYQGQFHALLAGALLPLFANVLFVGGLLPAGLDPTPHAFAASGLLFGWALFRHDLFDLVPVARDMVIDSLDDAVIVVDRSRRVLDLNNAARDLAATTEWLGERVEDLLPFLFHGEHGAVVDHEQDGAPGRHQSQSTGPQRQHFRDLRDSSTSAGSVIEATIAGVARAFDVRLMPVRTKAQRDLGAFVMLVRDITLQRRADAERAELASRVQEQQQRESLSVLAGGLAHDFNNLLAGIVGNADLLSLKLSPSSEMGGNVGAILLGAQRAADLVDKMLAYAGERHGSMSRIDFDELVRDLLDLLQAAAARHCRLQYEGTPAFIEADVTQIRQVAMNLIINAAEAVEEGTGIVRVRTGIERLSPRQLAEVDAAPDAAPGMYAYLEVRDNGHGMDQETMQRIFNPFFTTKPEGHGLGLAAVQGIVRGHRGALRVDSTPGFGSKFCVWFPLAEGAGTAAHGTGVAQDQIAPASAEAEVRKR